MTKVIKIGSLLEKGMKIQGRFHNRAFTLFSFKKKKVYFKKTLKE